MENHFFNIGSLKIGNGFPVRVQTMTNTPTEDVKSTLAQTIRCIEAGAELVRITTPTLADVKSLEKIHKELRASGFNTPLIADVHFNPNVALEAAKIVEKVRINPGNYIDKKNFRQVEFSDAEYTLELEKIHERLTPLLNTCRDNGTAIRIGVNHGSLSDRIMSRYGDSPEGMVQSALEFLEICRLENFHRVVISMKASNLRIMIYATRMVHDRMIANGYLYPLHLGVTEAGEGEDGRIKSAAGIGALLMEGIGDTIRVSLTEEPEQEIPVALQLVSLSSQLRKKGEDFKIGKSLHSRKDEPHTNRYTFTRRVSSAIGPAGGHNVPVLLSEHIGNRGETFKPEFIYLKKPSLLLELDINSFYFCDAEAWEDLFLDQKNVFPLVEMEIFRHWRKSHRHPAFLHAEPRQLDEITLEWLKEEENTIILLQSFEKDTVPDLKRGIAGMKGRNLMLPVILVLNLAEDETERLQVKAANLAGAILVDGEVDGFWLRNAGNLELSVVDSISMGIMQACRLRTYRTEYIACPSCGRTLFNLTDVLKKIKEETSHLTHLKIGVMGCIVNGPGEMADADYGYVGAGPGKINLYMGKELIRKNIPEDSAVGELVSLIKEMGDWQEKIL